ncbi:tetratricopeptide repeat protein [Deferrisoma camini]|uniref:tetratricopeptide repeat protein n=1 Tax=Deferrisoma camini TaxID=1035120 RepID=UPI00146BEE46|nr:tetratricopeptide repeat protein [Deferrisoma camini]
MEGADYTSTDHVALGYNKMWRGEKYYAYAKEEFLYLISYRNYEHLRSESPAGVLSLRGLSELSLRMKNPDLATKWYVKALQLKPESSVYWNGLANHLFRAGQYREALKAAKRAESLNPQDLQLTYNRALIEVALGKIDDARATLTFLRKKKFSPKRCEKLEKIIESLQGEGSGNGTSDKPAAAEEASAQQ